MCDNIDTHIEEGKTFDLFRAVRCSVVDVISSVCFGRNLNTASIPQFDAPLMHALHTTIAMVPAMKHFPFMRASDGWCGATVGSAHPLFRRRCAVRCSLLTVRCWRLLTDAVDGQGGLHPCLVWAVSLIMGRPAAPRQLSSVARRTEPTTRCTPSSTVAL